MKALKRKRNQYESYRAYLQVDHKFLAIYNLLRILVSDLLHWFLRNDESRLVSEAVRKGYVAIASQLQRSATSVTANLQEGYGKGSSASFVTFARIARGSLWESLDHLESLQIFFKNDESLQDIKIRFQNAMVKYDKEFYVDLLDGHIDGLVEQSDDSEIINVHID